MSYPKIEHERARGRDGNSLEQEVKPRLNIRDTILDRGQQELPDIRPKDRSEPKDILPPQPPSTTEKEKPKVQLTLVTLNVLWNFFQICRNLLLISKNEALRRGVPWQQYYVSHTLRQG